MTASNLAMKTLRYERDAQGIVTLTFDAADAPVNTMSKDWQADLQAAVDRLVAERADVKGVLLASAKSSFFAGAELKELLSLAPADAPAVYREVEALKRNFRRLETLGVPVVALLNGTALGGGWEVALAAHHRIAVDDARIQFGFPEVTLGLLPGATGVTKTVRLLGLVDAMPYLLEGRQMTPREAHERGLVHALVPSASALVEAGRAWIAAHPTAVQPWDAKDWKMPGGGPTHPKIAEGLAVAPAMLRQKTRGRYPAPEAILACMVEGARVDYETALRIESRHLAALAVGQVAKNMIQAFFFDLTAIKNGASRPAGIPRWKAGRVGILGAGMMGAGIAYANATRGIDCVLKDLSREKAEQGKAHAEALTAKAVAGGRLRAEEQARILGRIRPTADAAELVGCDLIIEAVFEKRSLKAEVTQEAEPYVAPGGFFASNTSTLPITGLAQAARRPERFIGLHFFSPVEKMRLVEIIRGATTSEETLAQAYDYVLQLGKIPIVVNDARGFFTSRTFATFVREGAAMLAEGIPAAAIENAALAAGMPVGPLAVLDETSLSLAQAVADQTRADLAAEGKPYPAQPGEEIIARMLRDFGRAGRAAGGGFYDYPADGRKRLWPGLKSHFERPGVAWRSEALQERFLYRQAIEAARCLEEGVLVSERDGNIGSLFGIGFPAWTGGALQFIRGVGPAAFVARAQALAAELGPRFAPPALLGSWA